jgi:4-amino-4-deoxy-L-arabinose transferase-like glycosyltransferase
MRPCAVVAGQVTTIGAIPGKARSLAAPGAVLLVALLSRVIAARVLQSFVDRLEPARLCVFPDTNYYWLLASTIRRGGPYEIVEWGTVSYKAVRTPGYPLFLAACQAVMGEWPLGVRLVQAVLGTASVALVYLLTRRFEPSMRSAAGNGALGRTAGLFRSADGTPSVPATGRWRSASVAAGMLAAINPYYVVISELLLSEALFMPLMLAALWGLAVLWRARGEDQWMTWGPRALVAIAVGAAGGAATLAKPSFALFLPAVLVCWLVACVWSRDRRLLEGACWSALLIAIGIALVMSPWWVRNARTYGRFVATSVWFGASLYDGLNPSATGASDMRFREAPEFRVLSEVEQDAELTKRAIEFVRENPSRVLALAVIKVGRYFSPWPNAVEVRSRWLAVASAVIVIPVYCLIVAGVWDRRRDVRALVLLAGPLVYFSVVHLVFVSSIRYRIPGEMVATSLAGIGLASIVGRVPTKIDR